MKTKIMLVVAALMALVLVSCDLQYKKTKSGLAYKIIKGNSRDSLTKNNNVIKFNILWKYKDSILYDSHGKMPEYMQVSDQQKNTYSYVELFPLLRKGDSAVAVIMVDTLFKRGLQKQLPYAKKGDRINIFLKVLDVFRADSLADANYKMEYEKYRPIMEKEAKEAMAKQRQIEENELQAYFTTKNIKPQKAPLGTYVVVNDKGSGEPAVNGKFVAVKYDGRLVKNDQQFDAGVYVFQLGLGNAIQGWHDGIPLFNKGGKGVLYVPGSLAYGSDPRGPGGPNSALKFDIEVLEVSDKQEKADAVKQLADSLAAKKAVQ